MNLILDVNTIAQGVFVLVMVGIARAIWTTTITLAKLGASFDAHLAAYKEDKTALRREIEDVREELRAPYVASRH